MHVLQRLWLRCTLCWKKGQDAEAARLCLLNDVLHREGKLCGAAVATLPRWRAQALRGAWAESSSPCTAENVPRLPSVDDANHVLFLTVPDSMFVVRRTGK